MQVTNNSKSILKVKNWSCNHFFYKSIGLNLTIFFGIGWILLSSFKDFNNLSCIRSSSSSFREVTKNFSSAQSRDLINALKPFFPNQSAEVRLSGHMYIYKSIEWLKVKRVQELRNAYRQNV